MINPVLERELRKTGFKKPLTFYELNKAVRKHHPIAHYIKRGDEDFEVLGQAGKTFEEALAKLWLQYNNERRN